MIGEMSAYRQILVALDGSNAAHHALAVALRWPAARVTAAAVVPPPPGGLKDASPEIAAVLRAPYEEALARGRDLAATQGADLTTLLLTGEPHEAISQAARGQGADLVVIGKRGQDLPPGALMGKVTERVIGYCPLDVLVVPEEADLGLERLLLPVDGSRFSRRAQARALELAADVTGELVAVSVLDVPPGFAAEVPEVARDLHEKLAELVAGVAWEAQARDLSCRSTVAEGAAYRVIVELAREWQAGLIVMGSHGRTGLKRLLMGSVTERVVGLAPCPVLVVKAG
jgi:nucleotide-binding universal stress UspA family protein